MEATSLLFPLVQLPKKLKEILEAHQEITKATFPLVQLPKKLKAQWSMSKEPLHTLMFPLVQLPKKLKA